MRMKNPRPVRRGFAFVELDSGIRRHDEEKARFLAALEMTKARVQE